MSCFIVNPRTIAYIANFMCTHINSGFNCTHVSAEIPKDFLKMVCDNRGFADAELIYKKLYLLNWQAFNTRYEGRYAENLDQCAADMRKFAEYDNTLFGADKWEYQMLKSINCYLYQCSESAELENSPTYQAVKALRMGLMNRIVSRLPEYQAAEWN